MTRRHGFATHAYLLLIFALTLGLAGCEGDDGTNGTDGTNGADGAAGSDGQACWDINNNGIGDLPDEDFNNDGVVDVYDCNPLAGGGGYSPAQLHAGYFTDNPYEGTQSCLNCHGKLADEFIGTAHFEWEGVATNIINDPAGIHGKKDILNNFCIAIPTNEGRCTQCHAGYGYADENFDFGDTDNIDCLVCHDQTNTYAKGPKTAGMPDPAVDLAAVARSVAMGRPTIDNCIDCHAKAGGGNNVKHGDIAMSFANTTRDYDVHMGTDGEDYECIECHTVQRDANDNMVSHGIGGMPYHSVDEGVMKECDDCHGSIPNIHAGTTIEVAFQNDRHMRLACQVCHIPVFARNLTEPTKVEWYWETAGQDIDPIPTDPVTGMPLYNKMKGSFAWANNVRPKLLWFNGMYEKALINTNDTFPDPGPAVLAMPVGDYTDNAAMIYPFKEMIGNQPADSDDDQILVPHLFGSAGGPNPYWVHYDWNLALQDADLVTNQGYSGDYYFKDTVMYLSINHEVAPADQAWGMDGDCGDCHFDDQIDWTALGWDGDPAEGGDRIVP